MDRRAVIAATKLRIGLFLGIMYVIIFAMVQLDYKSGAVWDVLATTLFIGMIVFLVSAIARIVHYVYDEW